LGYSYQVDGKLIFLGNAPNQIFVLLKTIDERVDEVSLGLALQLAD